MNWKEIKAMLFFVFFTLAFWLTLGFAISKYIIRQPQETKTEIISSDEHRENLGIMLITKYHLDECKNKKTKTGETPAVGTCAISPDLKNILWMNDYVFVEGYGRYRVNTLTAEKEKRTGAILQRVIDIYVDDLQELKKHKVSRRRVFLLKEK